MNAEALDIILEQLEPVFEKKGFSPKGEEAAGQYSNGEVTVRIVFLEDKNLFELHLCRSAEITEASQWDVLSSWLFLPDYGEKDAKSIGFDFADSLKSALGIKPEKSRSNGVDLPGKGNPGDSPTPEVLAQRFLAVFPQYKDAYRDHVAANGVCLYVSFFEEYAVPHLRGLLRENNAKHLQKFMEFLNEVYTLGNKDAQALVSCVILGGAIEHDKELLQTAESYMEEYPYLKTATRHMFHYLAHHKKK